MARPLIGHAYTSFFPRARALSIESMNAEDGQLHVRMRRYARAYARETWRARMWRYEHLVRDGNDE